MGVSVNVWCKVGAKGTIIAHCRGTAHDGGGGSGCAWSAVSPVGPFPSAGRFFCRGTCVVLVNWCLFWRPGVEVGMSIW